MSKSVSPRRCRGLLVKGLFTVAAAALLSACSNSVDRFQSAYSNPSDADPVYTASVPKSVQVPAYRKKPSLAAVDAAGTVDDVIDESPVARAPLGTAPAYDYTANYKKTYKQPSAASPRRFNAPQPSYEDETDVADNAVPVARGAVASSSGTVTVASGMTLYSVARANSLDPMTLASYNGMKPPYHVFTGQKLRIPASDEASMPQTSRKPRKQMALVDEAPPTRQKSGKTHTVSGGETLYALGRKYHVSPFVIADANGLSHDKGLHIGQKLKIPGARAPMSKALVAEVDAETEISATPKPLKRRAPLALTEDEDMASADSSTDDPASDEIAEVPMPPKAKFKKASPEVDQEVAQLPATTSLSLRWPLKGKVISNFGPKSSGLKNEGINIAVPEGTSVRAAENGVVAYAGNELKGYGNLVLIRHAGGYVTAYAHAKELLVKRGDSVKRGEVIAKAGQTGAVSSPQLHFEVRKGATALDPLKHLSSATAMN